MEMKLKWLDLIQNHFQRQTFALASSINKGIILVINIQNISDVGAAKGRVKTERDGTRSETRFRLPAKRTSPFISAGVSVQSSTGFLGVRVGGERL